MTIYIHKARFIFYRAGIRLGYLTDISKLPRPEETRAYYKNENKIILYTLKSNSCTFLCMLKINESLNFNHDNERKDILCTICDTLGK